MLARTRKTSLDIPSLFFCGGGFGPRCRGRGRPTAARPDARPPCPARGAVTYGDAIHSPAPLPTSAPYLPPFALLPVRRAGACRAGVSCGPRPCRTGAAPGRTLRPFGLPGHLQHAGQRPSDTVPAGHPVALALPRGRRQLRLQHPPPHTPRPSTPEHSPSGSLS